MYNFLYAMNASFFCLVHTENAVVHRTYGTVLVVLEV